MLIRLHHKDGNQPFLVPRKAITYVSHDTMFGTRIWLKGDADTVKVAETLDQVEAVVNGPVPPRNDAIV